VFIWQKKNMKLKRRNFFLEILLGIIVVYISVLVLLFIFQRNLMYHPNENNYFGDKLEVNIEKVNIKTPDNLNLLGWFHKKDLNRFKTIVYFHGNAGTLENRIHKLNHFKDMEINFLIIAWRGFSGNEGKPTEDGLYKDGMSAVNWIINQGVKEKDIILYGESLGTGIATELAQHKNFAGLILETPFTSMINAAKEFYPYIPVNLLIKDRYENYKKIKNIKIPILVMHGEKDTIVPFSMGKKIYQLANEPKYSYFTKHDDHMMVYDEPMIKTLKNFIQLN
jgi:fermentation-respiration switch protein FrsA (DUF1100 family)